jgi:alkaline phosphatase D
MTFSRRKFIAGGVGAGVLAGVGGCADGGRGDDDGEVAIGPKVRAFQVDAKTFAHGVASGDPWSDRVILWTRVSDLEKEEEVEISWLVAEDSDFEKVVAEGSANTGADLDFTVKVDVEGLSAGSTYYYAFYRGEGRTVVGRTRTLPEGKVDRARIAVTSCCNYGYGFFHAYRAIAERNDLDLWIALGDYIYEYGEDYYYDPTLGRALSPKTETIKLADYRARYALYRSDPDLQELHRQHPLIVVWDDHEVADNSFKDGARNHMEDAEGSWGDRKQAGTRAFLEWLPIRVSGTKLPPKIYRSFQFGELFDLIMLDTRLVGRDRTTGTDEPDADGLTDVGTPEQWADPSRTLLGDAQQDWFLSELSASQERGARWRLIGNQIIFSPTKDPRSSTIVFSDFWDGYQASRNAVIDHLQEKKIDNVVFLTGDIHSSWALDVSRDPYDATIYDPATGEGAFAVEFVGPSVTSEALENSPLADSASGLLKLANPHLKFSDVTRKGYVLVDVSEKRAQGEWYFVKDIKKKSGAAAELAAVFSCEDGKPRLVAGEKASEPTEGAPALAPKG